MWARRRREPTRPRGGQERRRRQSRLGEARARVYSTRARVRGSAGHRGQSAARVARLRRHPPGRGTNSPIIPSCARVTHPRTGASTARADCQTVAPGSPGVDHDPRLRHRHHPESEGPVRIGVACGTRKIVRCALWKTGRSGAPVAEQWPRRGRCSRPANRSARRIRRRAHGASRGTSSGRDRRRAPRSAGSRPAGTSRVRADVRAREIERRPMALVSTASTRYEGVRWRAGTRSPAASRRPHGLGRPRP